eukprot:CAMPEP_0174871014 /NCGR_PEP_ID=MMETSP1114-20130205/70720_1 /TAXON_ID=312471 /ORGANISM="Neobodo designis, Strain CCAP 1951/1" /LENGTH=56 /DNA_ID=CAMNT_0016106289 /DNA_START=27 /DNA_END=194 /DNA_ORIENTATION=+
MHGAPARVQTREGGVDVAAQALKVRRLSVGPRAEAVVMSSDLEHAGDIAVCRRPDR